MGRKPKHREPTEQEADDDVQDRANGPNKRDLQHHLKEIAAAKQKKSDADMHLAGKYSAAEACGLDKKAIKTLLKIMAQDSEKTKEEFQTVIKYAQWMSAPIGKQLHFFEDGTEDPEVTAHAEGKHAGAQGWSANKNPYPGGSKLEPVWEKGRMEGQAGIINGGASGKVANLNTERKKRAKKGEPVPPTEERREVVAHEAFDDVNKKKRGRPKKAAGAEMLQ